MYSEAKLGALGFDWNNFWQQINTGAQTATGIINAVRGHQVYDPQTGRYVTIPGTVLATPCPAGSTRNPTTGICEVPSGLPAWALPVGLGLLALMLVAK